MIQKKMNTSTTYMLQDQTSIRGFLQTKKNQNFNEEQFTYKSCDNCIVFPVQDKLPNGRLSTG